MYGGNILFGKKRKGKKLITNSNEMKVLEMTHKMRNDNISYTKISKHLNENNIVSKEKCKWYGSCLYLNGVLN